MAIRGPRIALGESGAGLDESVDEPERQTKERIAVMKKNIAQASQTAGMANRTHTFHQMNVVVFRASSAQRVALYMLLMVPKRTI